METAMSGKRTVAVPAAIALLCGCTSGGGGGDGGASSAGSGDISSICQKLSAYDQQCDNETPCAMAATSQCAQTYANFNPAYVAIVDTCFTPPYTCSDGGPAGFDSACVDSRVGTLQPDPAQSKLKADFCAACPDGSSTTYPSGCSGFFEATDGGSSLGTPSLYMNDSIVQDLDQHCLITGSGDCGQNFALCEGITIAALLAPPAACFGDGG
jgi:hypothetical protein